MLHSLIRCSEDEQHGQHRQSTCVPRRSPNRTIPRPVDCDDDGDDVDGVEDVDDVVVVTVTISSHHHSRILVTPRKQVERRVRLSTEVHPMSKDVDEGADAHYLMMMVLAMMAHDDDGQ